MPGEDSTSHPRAEAPYPGLKSRVSYEYVPPVQPFQDMPEAYYCKKPWASARGCGALVRGHDIRRISPASRKEALCISQEIPLIVFYRRTPIHLLYLAIKRHTQMMRFLILYILYHCTLRIIRYGTGKIIGSPTLKMSESGIRLHPNT